MADSPVARLPALDLPGVVEKLYESVKTGGASNNNMGSSNPSQGVILYIPAWQCCCGMP